MTSGDKKGLDLERVSMKLHNDCLEKYNILLSPLHIHRVLRMLEPGKILTKLKGAASKCTNSLPVMVMTVQKRV